MDTGFRFADRDDDYPETWIEFDAGGHPRLKKYYRGARARRFVVAPDGRVGSGTNAWFLPGKFRLCLRCGNTQGGAARDRTRLASLSAEGRSSATTVLVGSALRWMHGAESGMDRYTRKLLGFTDNRQDAALQAGHFNDFLFVSLVRAGFLGALRDAGSNGLRSDELGVAQQRTLGFDQPDPQIRAEWLLEPTLRGFNLHDAEGTLRQVLTYRIWFDQRRGWRYTNPNLEQLGLVRVEYLGLEDLAAGRRAVRRFASPAEACRPRAPGGRLSRAARSHAEVDGDTQPGSRHRRPGAVGREVAQPAPAPLGTRRRREAESRPLADDRRAHAPGRHAARHGADRARRIAKRSGANVAPDEVLGWRHVHPRPERERVRPARRGPPSCGRDARPRVGGEHTVRPARVAPQRRVCPLPVGRRTGERGERQGLRAQRVLPRPLREPRDDAPRPAAPALRVRGHASTPPRSIATTGRSGRSASVSASANREELDKEEKRLRDAGEANRFLPVLFCSPTMELGVDIAALNAVHMRNVPPTPANYAQRGGRAGRSGQAALVITYASSQSPHDQYFFRDPKAMVYGEVRAPILELANRNLIDSHLQAVWLSCVDQPLNSCIAELLVLDDAGRPIDPDLQAALKHKRVADDAGKRIRRVLDLVADELGPELAPWYTGTEAYSDAIVAAAAERFDEAFNRWRDLFAAAEEQRDAARRTMDDYSASYRDKRAAQTRHAQAVDQLNLLQRGTNAISSDFYTYRYLATEGFLPGYNFPRLPLLAYVPASRDGRGRQTYLQRPRFLALSEFGPRSLVYHEGRAYRVVRALLSLGHRESATPDARLPTRAVRICASCGAGHFGDDRSMCHACGQSLGNAEVVGNTYRIENVATYPPSTSPRTTKNASDRASTCRRRSSGRFGIRRSTCGAPSATDADGEIVRMAYGTGATITRLNKGLRRRADKKILGFRIDPVSGYWARSEDEDEEERSLDPTASPRQWIVPSVQDRKNALLFQPVGDAFSEVTLATVQHAILRGIEAVFQLEEGEMLAEPMPTRDVRNGFLLYEATEGGAGVLTRLVSQETSLADVARKALQIMHFAVGDDSLPASPADLADQPDANCVAACYRCLMSYYNQPDHESLDRRDEDARAMLLRLARAHTVPRGARPQPVRISLGEVALGGLEATVTVSVVSAAAQWREEAARRGIPEPDPKPLVAGERSVRRVWRRHYVAALVGEADRLALQPLEDLGFEVIQFEDPEDWRAPFARLTSALGLAS